jgi:polyisoprenoid-binding protein YceI
MKRISILFAAVLAQLAVFAQTKWAVDKSHSTVKFSVSHMVISEVEGNFKVYDGSITAPTADFNGAKVDFAVDVNSINTESEIRDKHLKGDDFFNSEKFPKMTFTSTSFKKVSGNKYALFGNLTIRDVTKPVKFDVVYGGTVKDLYGSIRSGFKATTVINRFDYNLKWNAVTEAGGAAVGKDVTLDLKMEFTQAK